MPPRDNRALLRPLPRVEADREEEEALLQLARSGDDNAWRRLYDAEFDAVYRYACFLLGDIDAAQDVAQEVFKRALVATPGFRGECRLPTWLRRIALNVCREHRRRTARDHRLRRNLEALTEPTGHEPELEHDDQVKFRALYSALAELPEALREAFVMRDVAGVDAAEAAAELGITRAHLAVRTYRARKALRKILARQGWGAGGTDA